MGLAKTADDAETVGIPVGSPTEFKAESRAIGSPWNTGLFDCHENQTNDEMGRIEASELYGAGQQMAQPVAMAPVIQQPELTNIQGVFYQVPSIGGTSQDIVTGRPWNTGLFDCHEHQTDAVMTAFFPCVTFGQIAEVMDEGEMTCPLGSFIYALMMPALCTQWIMGTKYRTKLRQRYNLVEAPYQDVVSHVFCPCCSLCQEFRELKSRGLDPALGWKGIQAQRQCQGQELKAPSNQAMFK